MDGRGDRYLDVTLRRLRHPDRRDSADRHHTSEAAAHRRRSLDEISFIDPDQIADALNTVYTAVYTAEGDYHNAAISAAGMAVVFGGGKAIRLTGDQVQRLAAGTADEFIQASLTRLARDGALTDDAINRAVADVANQFGDDTARPLKTSLQRIAGDGGAWLDDAVIARVPADWPLRIDRGVPTSPYETQRVDHVIVRH